MAALASPEEFMGFLKKAHDDFQSLSTELKFNKQHALHRILVALYGSILEFTGSCIHLLDRRLLTEPLYCSVPFLKHMLIL